MEFSSCGHVYHHHFFDSPCRHLLWVEELTTSECNEIYYQIQTLPFPSHTHTHMHTAGQKLIYPRKKTPYPVFPQMFSNCMEFVVSSSLKNAIPCHEFCQGSQDVVSYCDSFLLVLPRLCRPWLAGKTGRRIQYSGVWIAQMTKLASLGSC